jgi:hypothetical protein
MRDPSGENTAPMAEANASPGAGSDPCRCLEIAAPVLASQSITMPSRDHASIAAPSGENIASLTKGWLVCAISTPVAEFQMRKTLSRPHESTEELFGANFA